MYYPTTEFWVFAPMVITADEAEEFVALAKSLGLKTVGIMIEVPEIAEPSQLARVLAVADFVSIGTNDLTQYVLGGNRHNGSLALSDARDPKVMSIIESVVAQAVLAGKPVAICGEAASDAESAKLFMKLGVDSLSASPALIPQLRVALAEVSR
jgi:phosphotransferase system enzyme I (PtsI)